MDGSNASIMVAMMMGAHCADIRRKRGDLGELGQLRNCELGAMGLLGFGECDCALWAALMDKLFLHGRAGTIRDSIIGIQVQNHTFIKILNLQINF